MGNPLKPFSVLTNTVRVQEIAGILVRYGFGELLDHLDVPPAWKRLEELSNTKGLSTWQRIRGALEELGPSFVKLGQLLSTRGDILPEALILELKLLRNQVKTEPFEKIKRVLDDELDQPIGEYFSQFDEVPSAAGSLAQVYRAVYKETGQNVAVKVQRPGIQREIQADLDIISWFARQVHSNVAQLRPYNLPAVIEETGIALLEELDFTIEARNTTLFNALNENPEAVFAPEVFEEISSHRVLVMDWVDGVTVDDPEIIRTCGPDLAQLGSESMMHQMIITGFFHADPHPGNLLVTADGRLCILDWGLTGQLTRDMRYFLADLFSALTSRQPEQVVRVAAGANRENLRRLNRQKLEKEVLYVMRKYNSVLSEGTGFGKVGLELIYVLGTNGIDIARDYTLLVRAIIATEETGKTLDPAFDIRKSATQYLKALGWERWNPSTLLDESVYHLRDTLSRIRDLPGDLQRLFRRFEEEDVGINLQHRGLEDLDDALNSASSRLTLALIVASGIIGSSILIAAQQDRVGFVVFISSVLFGLVIVIDILRHGRHR